MITIIQGEDKPLSLIFATITGRWSLVGLTAMEIKFPGTSATISKTLLSGAIVVTSAANGECSVALDNADTAGMTVGENISAEVIADFGTTRRIFQLQKKFAVRATLF